MRKLLAKYRLIYEKAYPLFIIISALIAILSDAFIDPSRMSLYYLPLILSAISCLLLFMYAFNRLFPNAHYFIRIKHIPRKDKGIGLDKEEPEKKRISKAMDTFLNVSSLLIPLSLVLFIICFLL